MKLSRSLILSAVLCLNSVVGVASAQETPNFMPIHVSVIPIKSTVGYTLTVRVFLFPENQQRVGQLITIYPDDVAVNSGSIPIIINHNSFSYTFNQSTETVGQVRVLVNILASYRNYYGSTVSFVYAVPNDDEGHVVGWVNSSLPEPSTEVLVKLSPQSQERWVAVTYANLFIPDRRGNELVSSLSVLHKVKNLDLNVFDIQGSPIEGDLRLGPAQMLYRLNPRVQQFDNTTITWIKDLYQLTSKQYLTAEKVSDFLKADLEEGSGSFYPPFG